MKKTILEAAKDLTQHTWIPYQYFEIAETLLALNVSSSEDSLQEYALYKLNPDTGELVKFESLTVSWYQEAELVRDLEKYETESFDVLTHNNFWANPANNTFGIPIITPEGFNRFKSEFSRFATTY
ncbi:hypothetical protein [Alicyclobacillus fodiniaquatilis]|uniref:Uncharacterized protein n=1 Tax=Alicyclobacillus fodiniaquatilis TaxID=1661150 RepID=A0ABW4JKL2_9BACL